MRGFPVFVFSTLLVLSACGRSDNPAPGPAPDANPVAPPLAPSSPTSPTSTGGPSVSESLQVAPYRVRCLTRNQSSCLSIVDATGAPLFEIETIDGFEFQWGHQYQLATTRDQDGNFTLVNVISDQPVSSGQTFQQSITRGSVTYDNSTSCNFRLVAGAGFTTASSQVCRQLQNLLNQLPTGGRSLVGTFGFTGDADQQLKLQSVRTENVADWSLLRETDVITNPVGPSTQNCLESVFEIQNTGAFAVRSCGTGDVLQQGYLDAADLTAVNTAYAQTIKKPLGQRTCLNSEAASNHAVFLTTAAGGSYNLQNSSRGEVCFRGDQASAEQLIQTLQQIKARYDIYKSP